MAKKKKKKNGKSNGNVGGKADVHVSSNGSRNKSLLGHNYMIVAVLQGISA